MMYTKEQLHVDNTQRTYPGEAKEAAFLLGGVGTGNISLGSRVWMRYRERRFREKSL
ncbi:hypothetical protein [Paenibacillus sp. PL91]|uniref:hypothetical protein n=1 Tax=Paenibacillus sp. PL91 TaxID=2729538 RepID=UPI00145DBD24|nr:hypothetical protein [Paenibacillus sp. PL91]MBC9200675.1 hypothetical protein [Paenibacillus sp. PL91]